MTTTLTSTQVLRSTVYVSVLLIYIYPLFWNSFRRGTLACESFVKKEEYLSSSLRISTNTGRHEYTTSTPGNTAKGVYPCTLLHLQDEYRTIFENVKY